MRTALGLEESEVVTGGRGQVQAQAWEVWSLHSSFPPNLAFGTQRTPCPSSHRLALTVRAPLIPLSHAHGQEPLMTGFHCLLYCPSHQGLPGSHLPRCICCVLLTTHTHGASPSPSVLIFLQTSSSEVLHRDNSTS
ncbi:hypothetical protein Cadr_000012354 [Camelus dromedarius]|uniref:Uncharacterized protein n=1 Tax=Camelus dromedarius TaxID=9838 RepID=A0A5N4DQU5_CAMDR|nr:hypothetical protein Cadr_000012354 [Camelus dromedarius]